MRFRTWQIINGIHREIMPYVEVTGAASARFVKVNKRRQSNSCKRRPDLLKTRHPGTYFQV